MFGGWQQRWRHHAATLNCAMTFSIFLPPTQDNEPPPVLYWLSGLTCNDENLPPKQARSVSQQNWALYW